MTNMSQAAFDIEAFPNYCLLLAADRNGNVVYERARGVLQSQKGTIADLLDHELLTWNGSSFDLPILGALIGGLNLDGVQRMVEEIIGGEPGWAVARRMAVEIPKPRSHIDLMNVTPGIRQGLKTAGARVHARTIRDIPVEPGTTLTAEQAHEVRQYCMNDLALTWKLYDELEDRINVRRAIGPWALSATDAMIAERAMRRGSRSSAKIPTNVIPKRPPWLKLTTDAGRKLESVMLNREYTVHRGSGRVVTTPKVDVELNGLGFRCGIGGIHSDEKAVTAHDVHMVDVTSYYPNILMQMKPRPVGAPHFAKTLRQHYDGRLKAKAEGDKTTDAVSKVVLNSSSGKLASHWSCMYDPEAYLSMTLAGQLAMFMLVEKLTAAGAKVLSANTDGLVVEGPIAAAAEWEAATGLPLEYTALSHYWGRDVSSYLAVDEHGNEKRKGAFAKRSLAKMPAGEIIADAAARRLRTGKSQYDWMMATTACEPFVFARKVTGGAQWNCKWRGGWLGKVVRWVLAEDVGAPIVYVKSGNLVSSAASALPVMELPDQRPRGTDVAEYLRRSEDLVRSTGAEGG